MLTHQPTGLYGWIKSNDGRSLGLFLAFLMAVQLLAIPSLFFPLMLLDAAHAPFLGWGGYFLRYAPLVLAGSVVWFGWKYWWHIETVKRAVGFHFVDNADEPYLCSVIEPLIVMWGLPIPFVGVIESEARNAFACGVGRKKAVVVVTRGLIDDLTREELSCVLAHELSHIKNGDIRLMAAANIFMSALTEMHRNNPMQMTPIHAVLAIAVPAVLPITLLGNLLGAVALRAGQTSRLLIASSREYIADAEAVQLTKNPGAMASALVKVEHAFRLKGLRAVDDSMMIAGETEGDNATHPTIAQRIAALARTTGSMVFNSPDSPSRATIATTPSLSQAEAAALLRRLPEARPIERIRRSTKPNWLALDQLGQISAVFAVVALVTLHWQEIGQPDKLLAKFDTRPIAVMIGNPLACHTGLLPSNACKGQVGSYAVFEGQNNTLAGNLAERSRERREAGHANPDLTLASLSKPGGERAEWPGQSGQLKGVFANFADPARHSFYSDDGTYSTKVPEELRIAELEQVGCYPSTFFHNDPKGKFRMVGDRQLDYSITKFEAEAEGLTISRGALGSADEADWLRSYLERREFLLTFSFSNWGLPGLERMRAAFDQPGHAAVVERIATRLADPTFAGALKPLERAMMKSLATRPQDFLPCGALKHMAPA
jgi:Zn-dependent protease with chaperone function